MCDGMRVPKRRQQAAFLVPIYHALWTKRLQFLTLVERSKLYLYGMIKVPECIVQAWRYIC